MARVKTSLIVKISFAYLCLSLVCLIVLWPHIYAGRVLTLEDLFFYRDDFEVGAALWLIAFAFLIMGATTALRQKVRAFQVESAARLPGWPNLNKTFLVGCLAAFCAAVAIGGTFWVFGDYPLSGDEFLANFHATILEHGRLTAPLPPEWRSYAQALQPRFLIAVPGSVEWAPGYFPVNAGLRAIGELVGARWLVSPVLAAFSVLAIFTVGRRMWPDQPELAAAAAILLASSAQFLLTAMTPFAMTAHLAFNLAWLWCFLRGGKWGHASAIAIGFLACGLHELAFHPLFVAPFVLQLWIERQWRLAILYTVAYACIVLFWLDFWQMVLPSAPLTSVRAGASRVQGVAAAVSRGPSGGLLDYAQQVAAHLSAKSPPRITTMAENFFRFLTWQSPLAMPLASMSIFSALRARSAPRYLWLGVLSTVIILFFLIPSQGYAWGYRYLGGLLGSICLLAALQWGRLLAHLSERAKTKAWVGFLAISALSLTVLLPIRAWQAARIVSPYAKAEAVIARSNSQVVIVSAAGGWFAFDLVRNDPFLRNSPLILDLENLSDDQLRHVCQRYSVSFFGKREASTYGILYSPKADDTAARSLCLNWRAAS